MLENIIFTFIMFLCFLIVVFCFICGFQFKKGKWLMLIAGYNELDKETREKMDNQKIGQEPGNICIATGLFLMIGGIVIWISSYFPFFKQMENALFLILVPTAIFIYYILKKVKKSNDYYKTFRKY